MITSERVNSFNLYSVFYNEEGYRDLKHLESVSVTNQDDIVIDLIERGYLDPQDLPFVEVIFPKDKSYYNVINTTTNALLFRIE